MVVRDAAARAPGHAVGVSLRKNFLWTCAANMSYGACQLGMLMVLAKLGTTDRVGQFALGLAVATPVIMFTNLHLRDVQATDARGEYGFADYLRLRLVGAGMALVVIAGIAFGTWYSSDTGLAIFWVGVARAVDAMGDVYYGLLQQHERMDRVAKSVALKSPGSLAALALGFGLSGSVAWGAAGAAVASALVLWLYDARSPHAVLEQNPAAGVRPAGEGEAGRTAGRLARLAWLALPLGIVMALISLNTSVPRYFIERHLGQRGLGLFAAVAQLMTAGSMVVSALGQSASARLARYYARGERRAFLDLLLRLAGPAVLLGGAAVLVAAVGGKPLLTVLYRAEYGEHADVLVWLMVAAGISYVSAVLGAGMMAARYFRAQVPLFALTTLATVIASAALIPGRGLLGGALAVLVGMGVQAVGGAAILAHALSRAKKVWLGSPRGELEGRKPG